MRSANAAPGPQRGPKVDALGRTEQLDGQDVSHVLNDAPQLPRRTHRHRYHVLLAAIGGDRVDAGGV